MADLTPYWQSDRGRIYKARAEDVYPLLDPGSVSLLVSDGPYAMGKAAWDKQGIDGLADWYAPHIEAWGQVCGASATVYLWNTAEGWARIDPVMRAAGWTFRSLVTWDKGGSKEDIGAAGMRSWPDWTEVCGMYQREAWAPNTCAGQEIAYAAGADERNWVRLWLREEWLCAAGLRSRQCDEALGTNGMAGHYFGASQWSLPTWEHYQTMHRYAQQHGPARERPYLVHPSCWQAPDPLSATYDHLRAEYDHLRAEYEASRPHFDCPLGVGNVWRHGQVTGKARLRAPDGSSLHPCQKPLAFSRRIIQASARPGELVLEPFGGTCRVAAAVEEMMPGDVRPYICVEPDEDGRDYLPAVVADIERRQDAMALTRRMGPVDVEPVQATQHNLFGDVP